MSTTIRISKKDKEKLDQLSRYLSFKTEKKLTQEELIRSLVEIGTENKQEMVQMIKGNDESSEDLSNDPFFNLPRIELEEEDSINVDKTLYGDF